MNLQGDAGEIVTQMEIRNLGRDWAVIEVHIPANGGGADLSTGTRLSLH